MSAIEPADNRQTHLVRVLFARHGAAEYLGHLDMMRLFERALRRAKTPLAYSRGYNPRPRLVFALPLGVGVAAEAEILEIETTQRLVPAQLLAALNPVLPSGVRAHTAFAVRPTRQSVMGRVVSAVYCLTAPSIADAAQRLMTLPAIWMEKKSKGGRRTLDIKPLIRSLETRETKEKAWFHVCSGSANHLRPDLILQALVCHAGLDENAAGNAEIVRERVLLIDDENGD